MAYYCDDSDNHLTSVVASGVTTSMVYDYDGNLVQKTVGGQVTRYVYAGGPAPIVEINVTAGTTKDFIQANGRTWGVMEATSNTYFHHDAIGSVVALSNDSGQVTDTYEYEPFGKVLEHQGRSQNDYQFVGGYGVRKLNDTLDTMGVRQYSETVGRFTTLDPMGRDSGQNNFYIYSNNNPTLFVDPTGEKAFNVFMSMITGGIAWRGGGTGLAEVTDSVCGDSSKYGLTFLGVTNGVSASLATSFQIQGTDDQRSWSFQGVGSIASVGAGGGVWGVSAGRVYVPNSLKSVDISGIDILSLGYGPSTFAVIWVGVYRNG